MKSQKTWFFENSTNFVRSSKANVGIGLVILGVVAIIAVIGLVLLFTRASKTEGAALLDLSIGRTYQSDQTIAPIYPTPEFIRSKGGYGVPAEPEKAYPAYVDYPSIQTKGSRTPAFIVSGKFSTGGFATLEDMYGCERDLMLAGIGVPHDLYNAYSVPNKGGEPEVYGRYPPDSAAEARPTSDYYGKTGGDMYVYMNSVGAEQTMQGVSSEDLNRELIMIKLVKGSVSVEKYNWGYTIVNGKEVPVCWVSAKTFPFRQ